MSRIPVPMSSAARLEVYQRQNGGKRLRLRPRQRRRAVQKARRMGELLAPTLDGGWLLLRPMDSQAHELKRRPR